MDKKQMKRKIIELKKQLIQLQEELLEHMDDKDKELLVTTYNFADFSAKMIPTWTSLSNQIYKMIYKTNKTNKTEHIQRLEKWFCTVDTKPTKPKCKKEDFFLVLHGRSIPLNGKVLSVFTVLHTFLCQRDEKRYKKYYEEPLPPLPLELQNMKEFIAENKTSGRVIDIDRQRFKYRLNHT